MLKFGDNLRGPSLFKPANRRCENQMKPYQLILSGALASGALLAPAALAQVVLDATQIGVPTGTYSNVIGPGTQGTYANEFSAKFRWGGAGYEVGIRDNGADAPTLNGAGNPAWAGGNLNQNVPFRIQYAQATGLLTVSVDFDRNSVFASTESISRSTFLSGGNGLGLTSYAGYGFERVGIYINDTAPVNGEINSLMINGSSVTAPTFAGDTRWFYRNSDDSLFTDFTIEGNFKFYNATGASTENPTVHFEFRGAAIPEPSTYALMGGLALVGFAGVRRWRSKVS